MTKQGFKGHFIVPNRRGPEPENAVFSREYNRQSGSRGIYCSISLNRPTTNNWPLCSVEKSMINSYNKHEYQGTSVVAWKRMTFSYQVTRVGTTASRTIASCNSLAGSPTAR